MRLSRDKVNKLAHTVADTLATLDAVEFLEDRNSIRMEARRLLEELLKLAKSWCKKLKDQKARS